MCNASCSLYLWVLSIVTIATGLACLTAGTVGDSWWVQDDNNNTHNSGLWRICNEINNNETCYNRPNILEFEDIAIVNVNTQSTELDVVLLLMIIASGSAFLCLFFVLMMLICQSEIKAWKCGSLLTSLFTFISTIVAFAGLIYVEKEFEDKFDINDHGWSIIISWLGGCFMLISFILSFILLCVSERDFPENDTNYIKEDDPTGMANRGGAVTNKGYELS